MLVAIGRVWAGASLLICSAPTPDTGGDIHEKPFSVHNIRVFGTSRRNCSFHPPPAFYLWVGLLQRCPQTRDAVTAWQTVDQTGGRKGLQVPSLPCH